MDFDLSKENIQPLRGGRNVSQLGMALQAQTNQEYQRELAMQREEFENAIRNYTGSDPLEVWYSYVSWVEQSYPKHGHEGSVMMLLEDCLSKFEDDSRYANDRRFCKLWIKYIDMQQHPLELFQMMHAKGLCRGCADLYKAWAYYQEAAGDFQSANHIFELGKKELAQPYEELAVAHQTLIISAGRHMLYGSDQKSLEEKRQALTSLQTYKPGEVGSIRHVSQPTPGVFTTLNNSTRPTFGAMIYEDSGSEARGAEALSTSILTVAKRQEAPKENTLKPGAWTAMPVKKKFAVHREGSSFTVHEDDQDIVRSRHFPTQTQEDYKNWIVSLTLPEPVDSRMLPIYPKLRVYAEIGTEYSLEELRSVKYKRKRNKMEDKSMDYVLKAVTVMNQTPIVIVKDEDEDDIPLSALDATQSNPKCQVKSEDDNENFDGSPVTGESPASGKNVLGFSVWEESFREKSNEVDMAAPKFSIYEQSTTAMPEHRVEPKGSAMKTPFKDLNAEELAETGSRGGMDVAAAAPVDSAKRLPIYEDDSSSSSSYELSTRQSPNLADNSCANTQMFNFNLNAMQVSTPKQKALSNSTSGREQAVEESSRNIGTPRMPPQPLSVIMEETKSYHSSGAATKSSLFINHTKPSMAAISEEHNSYLAQNLMANAALRSSLLGDLTGHSITLPQVSTPPPVSALSVRIPSPVSVSPISHIPSDPFKPSLIVQLLNKVGFPGPHTRGFYEFCNVPRLQVKKDAARVGADKYIIEQQLGKGTYGTVFKGVEMKTGTTVALKYQKPPNKWEFYICRELQSRLADHPLRERFMDVRIGYFSDQASILISEFMPCGSLLRVANTVKANSGRTLKESLCIYFCLEMLKVIQVMHQVKIIHADVKPDNFLVQLAPDGTVSLQLIDFGCSIDMTLFPPDACFTRTITTEDFVCCEMKDGRPWNYHTDLYCVAATAHVLLFDKYIQLQKQDGLWSITHRLPRYLRLDLWNMFFSTLLNQQNGPADSNALQALLDDCLRLKLPDWHNDMRYLLNVLKNR